MTPDELAAALRAGARGHTASEAAVDLLVWREHLPADQRYVLRAAVAGAGLFAALAAAEREATP
jgi:hypothetical protein